MSKLFSFILMVSGNPGLRENVWRVHLVVVAGDQAIVYVPVQLYVCGSHTLLALSQSFDLATDSEMASKWLSAIFPPRPVVPHSLSSTSKPTHPSTYNQKKIE